VQARILAVALWGCIMGAGSAQAQAEPQKFRDWQMTCPENGAPCVMSSTTLAAEQAWLTTLNLSLLEDGGDAIVQVLVPAGVHLASGVFMRAGRNEPQMADFIVCSTEACAARLVLDAASFRLWRRSRQLEIRYKPTPRADPIAFDVSLMGLTAASRAAADLQ
jgi:invasion protein IalB